MQASKGPGAILKWLMSQTILKKQADDNQIKECTENSESDEDGITTITNLRPETADTRNP